MTGVAFELVQYFFNYALGKVRTIRRLKKIILVNLMMGIIETQKA
jgi:hypothetical protein